MEPLSVQHNVRIELIPYPRHEQLKKEVYDALLHYEDKQNHKTNVKAVMTEWNLTCLLYTSPSPRDRQKSRMPSSA